MAVGKIIDCVSPLMWYDSPDLQNHRRPWAFGHITPLLTPLGVIPPFQFVIKCDPASPEGEVALYTEDYYLVRLSDGKRFYCDFSYNGGDKPVMKAVTRGDGYATVYRPGGTAPLRNGESYNRPLIPFKEGLYYLELALSPYDMKVSEMDYYHVYSEVFCMSEHTGDWLRLDYASSVPLLLDRGMVAFPDNFRFTVYLDTVVGRPKYSFEEEATDRMGYAFIESQVSKKTFAFTAPAPEYLCDALRLMRLCDDRTVTGGGRTYQPVSFGMDVDWGEQGDVAALSCEFDTDTVVCSVGGYAPPPALRRAGFTDDFNLDFN